MLAKIGFVQERVTYRAWSSQMSNAEHLYGGLFILIA